MTDKGREKKSNKEKYKQKQKKKKISKQEKREGNPLENVGIVLEIILDHFMMLLGI